MSDESVAHRLLLRDMAEITLNVDLDAARDLPDRVLIETLGEAALAQVREAQDEP